MSIKNKIEKDFVLEYGLKFSMFEKSIPTLKKHLIKKKSKNNKNLFTKKILEESLIVLKDIELKKDINYYQAFTICLSLGQDYSDIAHKIRYENYSLNNLRNEEYWDIGIIDLNEAIFFSYTFLNEIYSQLNIDFNKLNNSDNIEKDYYELRNEILKNNK